MNIMLFFNNQFTTNGLTITEKIISKNSLNETDIICFKSVPRFSLLSFNLQGTKSSLYYLRTKKAVKGNTVLLDVLDVIQSPPFDLDQGRAFTHRSMHNVRDVKAQ